MTAGKCCPGSTVQPDEAACGSAASAGHPCTQQPQDLGSTAGPEADLAERVSVDPVCLGVPGYVTSHWF